MMSENNGFLYLWRSSMDSAVWAHDDIWKLWTLCLMLATWNEKTKGDLVLRPGQFVTGREHLHRAYHRGKRRIEKAKPCPRTLQRFLRQLEKWGNLSLNVSTLGTVVTICTWARYQELHSENVQPNVQRVSNECPGRVSKVSTSNKEKKVKKEKKEEAAVKKPTAAFTQFTDYFVEEWKKQTGQKYPWKSAKDGTAAAAVWTACDKDLPRAKKIVDAYFAERDKFYIGHTMAILGSHVAKFMVKATGVDPNSEEARKAEIKERSAKTMAELQAMTAEKAAGGQACG